MIDYTCSLKIMHLLDWSSGLSETKVNSAEEVLTLMRRAQNQRQVGETSMNKQSSRSHCIFTMKVQAKRKIGDGSMLEVSGKLHCVDLAGSECAKSADLEKGNDDHQAARERERMNINRSLLTLGRVVSMLKEQSQGKKNKSVRIPYRDSKLTRILQESLGGRCKTCLIATVSPSITAIEESMSTLNYAQAANGIINKPVTSSLMTSQPSSIPIGGEKKASGGDMGTVEHWHELECRLQYMQSQVEEAQHALARKHLQQQELVEKAEIAEAARDTALAAMEETRREKELLEKEIEEHIDEKNQISERLKKSEQTLRETVAILKATQKTESRLTHEAQELLSALRKSTEDGDFMHQTLMKNREDEILRRDATKTFKDSLIALLDESASALGAMGCAHENHGTRIRDLTYHHTNVQRSNIDQQRDLVNNVKQCISAAISLLKHQVTGDCGIKQTFDNVTHELDMRLKALRTLGADYGKDFLSESTILRQRLSEAAKVLGEMDEKYDASSAQLLAALEKDVMNCRENLSKMVSGMTKTLAIAFEERIKAKQKLNAMVQNWTTDAIGTSKTIGKVSTDQGKNVQSLLDVLNVESMRYEEVLRELSEQQEFISQQRTNQIKMLNHQHRALDAQRDVCNSSRQKTNELCHQVVANIMSGVEDLVKKELAAIANHQDNMMKNVECHNEEATKSNQELSGSFSDTLDHLQSKNEVIQEHSTVLREMDNKAATALRSSRDVFEQVHSDSVRQQRDIADATEAICKQMAVTEKADREQVDDITKSLVDQGGFNEAQLISCILDQTSTRSIDLLKISRETISFAKTELVDNTGRTLETCLEARAIAFENALDNLVNETRDQVAMSSKQIETITTQQEQCMDEASKQFEEQTSNLSLGFSTQERCIVDYQENIYSQCSAVEDSTKTHLNLCLANNANTKNSMNAYSRKVKVEEEPPAVPDRDHIRYSDELSSTPSDDIILQNMMSDPSWPFPGDSSAMPMIDDVQDENNFARTNDSKKTSTNEFVLHEKTNEHSVGEKRRASVCPPRSTSTTKRVRTYKQTLYSNYL